MFFNKKKEISLSDEDIILLEEIKIKKAEEKEKLEQEERMRKVLTTDPWNFDLIRKIAIETDLNFDLINNKTGQILRFYKKTNTVDILSISEEQAINEGVW